MAQLKTETDKGIEIKKTVDHSIEIRGARANNLKNISISIPKNKLIVVQAFQVLENHRSRWIFYLLRVNEGM